MEGGHDSGHDLGFVLVRQQSKPSSSTCLSDGVSNCKNRESEVSWLPISKGNWTAILETFANWFEDLSNLPKSAQSGWKAQHRFRMKFQGARAGIPAFCFSLGWCATEETMYNYPLYHTIYIYISHLYMNNHNVLWLLYINYFGGFPIISTNHFSQIRAETCRNSSSFRGPEAVHGPWRSRKQHRQAMCGLPFDNFQYFFVVPTITLTCSGFINQLV